MMESMRWIVAGSRRAIEADALLQRVREDVIGDLEAGLGGVPVDGGDVFEEVVAGGLEGLAGRDDVLGGDGEGQFVAVELGVGGEVCRATDGRDVGMRGEDGFGAERRWRASGVVHVRGLPCRWTS